MSRILLSLLVVLSPSLVLPAVGARAQEPVAKARPDAKAAVEAALRTGQQAVQDGDFEAGVVAFRTVTELDPKRGTGWHMLGYCLHAAKRLDEALAIHLKAAEFPDVAPMAIYNVACVHSLKGDQDKAIEWLQKAVASGFNDTATLAGDSDFDALRADPRFLAIADRMQNGVQVFAPTTNRRSARLAYFGGRGSPGQIAIDHAVLEWRDEFDASLQSPKLVGKKWRLGSDFWTTLDNSMPLRLGSVEIPAGYWYLTLERRGDRQFVLGVHDPVAVRKLHIDPFRAEQVQGGIEVPLQYAAAAKAHQELEIGIVLAPGQQTEGTFRIGFGGHELTAAAVIGLEVGAKSAK